MGIFRPSISGWLCARGVFVLGLILITASCRGGCVAKRKAGEAAQLASSFPADAEVLIAVDFSRARKSTLWRALSKMAESAMASAENEDAATLRRLAERTGLDPLTDVHRVVAAFPEQASKSREFGLVFSTAPVDISRLMAYAQDEGAARGSTLHQDRYAGFELWSSGTPGEPAAFFDGDTRAIIAGAGWAQKMAEIAQAPAAREKTAANNAALVDLASRLGVEHAFWLAAIVPPETRQRLRANPKFGAQASVMRFGVSMDLAPGLDVHLVADLSQAADAQQMVGKVQAFVKSAKESPQVLLLGLGPLLDGVKVAAEGPQASVRLTLDAQQTEEVIQRLEGWVGMRVNKISAPAVAPTPAKK